MIYFVCGMPLAGKSTTARRIALKMGLPYMSTGEFARSKGMGLESSIALTDMSASLNLDIVAEVGRFVRSNGEACVVDGFPRSTDQYEFISSLWHGYCIVFMSANPLSIYDRLEKRALTDGRPEDTRDVVVGRVRSSVDLRSKLKDLAGPKFMEVTEEEAFDMLMSRLS